MKILGLLMVLVSACGIGFYIGEKYISQLKGVKKAEKLVGNIILGLQSERLTLSEIFENIAVSGDLSTQSFIENLSFNNLSTVSKTAEESGFCCDKEAILILNEAFSVLGKYSAEEQIKELLFSREKLKRLYEKNEEDIKNKAKLSRCSGALAGVFIFIVLI